MSTKTETLGIDHIHESRDDGASAPRMTPRGIEWGVWCRHCGELPQDHAGYVSEAPEEAPAPKPKKKATKAAKK